MNETGEQIIPTKKDFVSAADFYADGFDQEAYLKSLPFLKRTKFIVNLKDGVAALPEEEQEKIRAKTFAKMQELQDKPNKTWNEKFWLSMAKTSEKSKKLLNKFKPKAA